MRAKLLKVVAVLTILAASGFADYPDILGPIKCC